MVVERADRRKFRCCLAIVLSFLAPRRSFLERSWSASGRFCTMTPGVGLPSAHCWSPIVGVWGRRVSDRGLPLGQRLATERRVKMIRLSKSSHLRAYFRRGVHGSLPRPRPTRTRIGRRRFRFLVSPGTAGDFRYLAGVKPLLSPPISRSRMGRSERVCATQANGG
jgi:hypothetical protein